MRRYLDGFKEALKQEKKEPKALRGWSNSALDEEENCDKRTFILYSAESSSFLKTLPINANPLTDNK